MIPDHHPPHLQALFQLRQSRIKLGLEKIQDLLALLGNPQAEQRIIHLAGTNGKGSTLAFLEALLMGLGKEVASTVSPHLVHYGERFRRNSQPASLKEVDRGLGIIAQALGLKPGQGFDQAWLQPTFFEVSIALAFVLFAQPRPDFLLLETGLGGRFDATNVVRSPLACLITSISKDHQEYLGHSLAQIAREKLGIAKPGSPLLVARQCQEVRQVVLEHGQTTGINLHLAGRDFDWEESGSHLRFWVGSKSWNLPKQALPLAGRHQWDNLSLALATLLLVVPEAASLSESNLAQALARVSWPGRLQSLGPKLLVDGAHNQGGIEALWSYLDQTRAGQDVLLASSWLARKDLSWQNLPPTRAKLQLQPLLFAAQDTGPPPDLARRLAQSGFPVLPELPLEDWVQGLPQWQDQHDLVVVTGSLYLLGQFFALWGQSELQA